LFPRTKRGQSILICHRRGRRKFRAWRHTEIAQFNIRDISARKQVEAEQS
jgi:hypothetical protein